MSRLDVVVAKSRSFDRFLVQSDGLLSLFMPVHCIAGEITFRIRGPAQVDEWLLTYAAEHGLEPGGSCRGKYIVSVSFRYRGVVTFDINLCTAIGSWNSRHRRDFVVVTSPLETGVGGDELWPIELNFSHNRVIRLARQPSIDLIFKIIGLDDVPKLRSGCPVQCNTGPLGVMSMRRSVGGGRWAPEEFLPGLRARHSFRGR